MVNLFRGFVFLWLSCIGIVHAADTGWLVSPQNDHARIRFQAEREQTHIKGLLTVELKPGWKTYWRSPGEGGVARTVGVGAGQMSRVVSVQIACEKAGDLAKGSSLASDAFFPFPDGIEAAAKNGVTAVAQPGGSVKDADVIAAADALGLAMVLTGVRHFRH